MLFVTDGCFAHTSSSTKYIEPLLKVGTIHNGCFVSGAEKQLSKVHMGGLRWLLGQGDLVNWCFYLLKKWQSDTPSMTRRKMRRKKKAPDKRYKTAVVTLKETLEMSDKSDMTRPFQLSPAKPNNKYFLFCEAISISLRGVCWSWNVHFIKSQNV